MRNVDSTGLAERIRGFNRFYTESIGSLDDRHEGLPVNLAQSRMLFTVHSLGRPQVTEIAERLQLDLAYTSRILGTLEDARLIRRTISPSDRRQRVVRLTPKGTRMLANIESRSNNRALAMVEHLNGSEVALLLVAMDHIKALITKQEHHARPRSAFPARDRSPRSV